jgi:hypothetical protein
VDEAFLLDINRIATEANSRWVIRALYKLRGEWKLTLGQWQEAAVQFEEHIRMTREVNLDASWSEARLVLTHVKLGHLAGSLESADRISATANPPHAALAELYLVLGEPEKTRRSALAGYMEAWGDGEPYVDFQTLRQCRRVLQAIGEPEPQLKSFDPTGVKPFAFEAKLAAYLDKKREENSSLENAV